MESDGFNEKANNIRQLAALDPTQLSDHLSEIHPNIGLVAPNIAPHVNTAAVNAIAFLNAKLPSTGDELSQDHEPDPSQAQKQAWLELHDIVSDPLSVLNHAQNETLTSHHIEALQSVYPDLHQEMIEKAQEYLGKMRLENKQLPYARRLSIGKLIGQPLDSTMTSQGMQAIMAANAGSGAQAQANQQKNPRKASGVELNQINKVNAIYDTAAQSRQLDKQK